MTHLHRGVAARVAVALVVALALGACGSPSSGATPKPGVPTEGPATNVAAAPTTLAAPGEPCSFIAEAALAAIVGATMVEAAEREGRGDCDYWLNGARDEKVNIGVTTGPDAQSVFDSTKGIGDPQPVSLGDEAYSIYNESIGTLVVVKKGDSVVVVQAFTRADQAKQLVAATALATAVVSGL